MVHIYAGNGKGKTTAAFGLALRFAFYEKKVVIIQFLKDGTSGEFRFLQNLKSPYITVKAFDSKRSFFWTLNDEQKAELKKEEYNALDYADRCAESGTELIILDEIIDSVNNNMIDITSLVNFIVKNKGKTEIVLTGRNPSKEIIELADYYTEMNMVKHPYSKGISAREGVEF